MSTPQAPGPGSAQQVATPQQGGHIIAVVGGKGGVGKSVFAANFAMAMAADAKNGPAVIDCDPNGSGDVQLILGVKQMPLYGDAIIDGKVADSALLRSQCPQVKVPNVPQPLFFLQMCQNPERLLSLDEDKLDLALKMLRRTFPITIIDCGSHLEGSMLKILDLASLVLVVTNPEILVLNQTKKILDKMQTALIPPDMTKIILNRYPANNPYNPQFIEQSLRRQVLSVVPEDVPATNAALAKGVPFSIGAPQSPATTALFQLSRLLIERKVLDQLSKFNRPQRPKTGPGSSAALTGAIDGKKAEDAGGGGKSKMGKEPKDPRSLFKLRLHAQLVDKMDLKKEQLERNVSPEKKLELRGKATKILTDILGVEDHPWKSREETAQIIKEVLDEALALGPLEDLLYDEAVTEIMVNRADQIYIERAGKPGLCKTTFSSNAQLMAIIERIVLAVGRRIDEKTPYVDARLADGSRVHAIIPPLALDGPMLTIRKFPKKRLGPQDLVNFASMTQEMADFLRLCIEARMNVVISGGTGSGKTTLLNVLSGFIPASERILTVEDSAELQLQQDHVGRLETRPPNIEGQGAITIRDLVKQTLRMRPDRIIIGEIRDGAALDLLQAMNTGHDGSMATVHANNPREAVSRLETLVMMAGMDLPAKAIREQLAGAVHLFVQQSRLSDGSRKVTHITEITGMQGEVITLQDIFLFKQTGMDANRKVVGKHVATGFVPKAVEKIMALGKNVPRGLFKAA